jgi:hypothetical protein
MKLGKVKVLDKSIAPLLDDAVIMMYTTKEEAVDNKPAGWRLWPDGIGLGIVLEDGKIVSISTGFEIWS